MSIEVFLEDHTGNVIREAKISEVASVGELIPGLITTLHLPVTDNVGHLISYNLSYRNRRLRENETLMSAEVHPGDTLSIVPTLLADDNQGSVILEPSSSLKQDLEITREVWVWVQAVPFILQAKLPETASTEQLIKLIITLLKRSGFELPITDPEGGWPIIYRLEYKGHHLQENETLLSANVQPKDRLTLVPHLFIGNRDVVPLELYAGEKGTKGTRGVVLEDHAGRLFGLIRLPETASTEQLIRIIVTGLQLPITDSAGRPITYYLLYKGHRLRENETLLSAELQSGDTLTLNSEMMAAGGNLTRIRIVEEPLTARNLATIFTSLASLYTKCNLVALGQFEDLIEYVQTRNDRFALEAGFIVTDITHNSPFSFDISLNPENVAKAMQLAIDAVSLRGLRKREMELSLEAKELGTKLIEQEVQSKESDREHLRQREALEAELEHQRQLLGIEKQQLELEKQRFEFHTMRIDYALKTAGEMISLLHPNIDEATKAMIVRTLLPDLLQLGEGKGLQLELPAPQENFSKDG